MPTAAGREHLSTRTPASHHGVFKRTNRKKTMTEQYCQSLPYRDTRGLHDRTKINQH